MTQNDGIKEYKSQIEELKELMDERVQMLEDALDRAEKGVATEEDWKLIRNECGLAN